MGLQAHIAPKPTHFWIVRLLKACSVLSEFFSLSQIGVKTRPSVLGFCKVARLWGPVWRPRWGVFGRHWHLNCGTRTIHLDSRVGRLPPAPTAPRSLLAPGPSPRRGIPGTGWTTRSLNWAGGTCSAPSCVSSGSSGACRTYRSLSLCSCRAYRWCARGSASSGHCCWRSVCRSRQIHIWRASHLWTVMVTIININQQTTDSKHSSSWMLTIRLRAIYWTVYLRDHNNNKGIPILKRHTWAWNKLSNKYPSISVTQQQQNT